MYSKVSKYSPEARKRMAYRSRQGKSCGYYMRIVFLFSSLIQSLIIVSLVLFLVYGNRQDQTSMERTQELEVRFSQVSLETLRLTQQSKNLTHLLNITAIEKARNDWELGQLRFAANISFILIEDMEKKLKQCNLEKLSTRVNCPSVNPYPVQPPYGCNCGTQMETLKAKMQLVQSNFTQTAMLMQMEMDQISRDRDNLNLEAIQLRRDKSVHDKAIQFYQIKCKEEFVNSLSGISNVSKAFLGKIDSLFHSLSPFHITCPKQKEYLEQIRTNCTDLSEEVVSKFQNYLDTLGGRVSMYQGNISVLTAENMRMTRDYNLCSQNRTALIREHKQNVARIQLRHDEEKEKLLKEKIKLKGDMDILDSSLKLKDLQLNHMNEQIKLLNLSCIPRSGGLYPRFGNQPGSSFGPQAGSSNPSLSSGGNPLNRNSFGSSSSSSFFGSNTNTGSSSNTGFNKPSSTGLGSSSSASNTGFGSSSSNTGFGSSSSNTGFGSSSSNTGFGSSSSNTGFGSSSSNNKGSSNQGSSPSLFGSFGSSSSGSSLNKQTSTGLGSSSSFGSSFGSSSNNPSSSSSSQSKLGSGTSSSGFGSSSSNTGSKFGSSSSSFGSNFGSSSSNLGSSSSNSGSSSSSSSKTTSNSQGSSNSLFGSSSSSSRSSLGSSLGSSSSTQNKLSSSSTNKGSSSSSSGSSSSSSSGSSATTSKSAFGGWFGLGGAGSSSSNGNSGSNTDQSKTASNQGRGTSSSGNPFGSFGRTNTFSYTGPISVNQHLKDLQRIINPQTQEQKQELSRILG